MSVLIKASQLVKEFKSANKSIKVLKNIDLTINKNDRIIIYGASGAGKSTLLNILSSLDFPDSGKVEFEEIDIFSKTDDEISAFRNQNIGFVFQFHHLLPEFTALENVAIPMMINGISYKNAMKKAEKMLHKVNLSDRFSHKPAELSGGEQQRVAIARALINSPKILFADEPTGNLDSENSKIIQDLLLDLHNKLDLTVVIVTHNSELEKIGNRIIKMEDGNIFEIS